MDFTKFPTEIDKKFDELDQDGAVHSTIINIGDTWTKHSQKSLLANPTTQTLTTTEQQQEKNSAFDLLDALSRSGGLVIDHASLHVVLASTHCFDKSLVNTVIQDNVNPIEKVESSGMIVASVVHEKNVLELINRNQVERVTAYSPLLLGDGIVM